MGQDMQKGRRIWRLITQRLVVEKAAELATRPANEGIAKVVRQIERGEICADGGCRRPP